MVLTASVHRLDEAETAVAQHPEYEAITEWVNAAYAHGDRLQHRAKG